jgi:hypothetical protein
MKLSTDDLMDAQAYRQYRAAHRRRLAAHREARTVSLGPAMRLQFEDALTVRWQIQEVLRSDNAFDAQSMQHEIDTYAHLLPDGRHWKATLFIELPEAEARRRDLPALSEAAHQLYVEVGRHGRARVRASDRADEAAGLRWKRCGAVGRVVAAANEDLPDRHLGRPSAVHFLRFALPEPLRAALLAGAPAALGCQHERYSFRRLIPPRTLLALCCDIAASPPRTRREPAGEALPAAERSAA